MGQRGGGTLKIAVERKMEQDFHSGGQDGSVIIALMSAKYLGRVSRLYRPHKFYTLFGLAFWIIGSILKWVLCPLTLLSFLKKMFNFLEKYWLSSRCHFGCLWMSHECFRGHFLSQIKKKVVDAVNLYIVSHSFSDILSWYISIFWCTVQKNKSLLYSIDY